MASVAIADLHNGGDRQDGQPHVQRVKLFDVHPYLGTSVTALRQVSVSFDILPHRVFEVVAVLGAHHGVGSTWPDFTRRAGIPRA
jgi:hypothetical protein